MSALLSISQTKEQQTALSEWVLVGIFVNFTIWHVGVGEGRGEKVCCRPWGGAGGGEACFASLTLQFILLYINLCSFLLSYLARHKHAHTVDTTGGREAPGGSHQRQGAQGDEDGQKGNSKCH